jgi:hypothetical protein
VPSEREGLVVATGLKNAPDVRRASASVASANGLPVGVPVIVRVTPPFGRDISLHLERRGQLGWSLLAELPGARQPIAAPCPMRRVDADELAAHLEASRADDAPPDRAALADLLVKVSHVVVDRDADLDALELGRVVVAPRGGGAVVVDARARLRKKKGA